MVDDKEIGKGSEGEVDIVRISGERALDVEIQEQLQETAARVLACLTPREERVLRMRYGIGLDADYSLDEVAREFSISLDRVREIEERATRKIKERDRQFGLNYAFRPVAAGDLPMIADWLRRPHVARWWPDPAEQIEVLRRNLAVPGFEALILLLRDRAAGYLQVYDASPGTAGATADQPPGTRGIDLFIGEVWALGWGLGSTFLRLATSRLFRDPAVLRVIADPDPDNAPSLRCFEKAGFRRDRVIHQPSGPAVLMVLSRDDLR